MPEKHKQKRCEPYVLKHGKDFHKKIQSNWENQAEGDVQREKSIKKPSGRAGRIDIHVEAGDDLVAVVEIKASNWDRMLESTVLKNVKRQARQIWNYIESQLTNNVNVSPGVIFPQLPKDPERVKLIEELFDEEGIPVVWEDESIEDCKARHESSSHNKRMQPT